MPVTANLPSNLPVKKFRKSVKIRQNYGDEYVALTTFFGSPCKTLMAAKHAINDK